MVHQGYERFTSTIGRDWPGFSAIEHIVIFGDSYSSIGYSSSSPHPTPEEPLGVKFPGITCTGPTREPNWVGCLARTRKTAGKPVLVHDYAVVGAMVFNVASQVRYQFKPHAGVKPAWAPWKQRDTLFVIWVGINDCGFYHTHEHDIERLFRIQEELYRLGARNFLLIDVPPVHQAPLFANRKETDSGETQMDAAATYRDWNTRLHLAAVAFYEQYNDVTLLMFSAWDAFSKIIDDPETHGFPPEDVSKAGGSVWVDHLHPTGKVHEFIADEIMNFLNAMPPYDGESD